MVTHTNTLQRRGVNGDITKLEAGRLVDSLCVSLQDNLLPECSELVEPGEPPNLCDWTGSSHKNCAAGVFE